MKASTEMTPENEKLLQGIMDAAYAKWQGKGWSYSEFIDELDALERKVVVVGKCFQQIFNGGFAQWADNRYGAEWGATARVMETVGTPACLAAAELVREVGRQLSYGRNGELQYGSSLYGYDDRGDYGRYDRDNDFDFDKEDDAFYVVGEQMMNDFADWVRAQQA